MSFIDKAKHKAEEVIGEFSRGRRGPSARLEKEVGELTGNEELEAEGKKDQLSGNVKHARASVRDAVSDITDIVAL